MFKLELINKRPVSNNCDQVGKNGINLVATSGRLLKTEKYVHLICALSTVQSFLMCVGDPHLLHLSLSASGLYMRGGIDGFL